MGLLPSLLSIPSQACSDRISDATPTWPATRECTWKASPARAKRLERALGFGNGSVLHQYQSAMCALSVGRALADGTTW